MAPENADTHPAGRVLSVQNIACETLGMLEGLLRSDGFAVESVNAPQDGGSGIPPSSSGYSAIIILGGPMAVYDGLPYLEREQGLIKDAIKNQVPVLGICLGSQLVAQAAGGRVYRGSRKEIGWHSVSLTPAGQSGLFSGISEKQMRVFQWHGDTYDLPRNAEVLAYSDLYPQAFRVGSAVGVQFHLEVDESLVRRWIQEYGAEVRAEKIDPARILPGPGDIEGLAAKCRVLYRNFARDMVASRRRG